MNSKQTRRLPNLKRCAGERRGSTRGPLRPVEVPQVNEDPVSKLLCNEVQTLSEFRRLP